MDDQQEEKPFAVDRAKAGRAACKKCKEKCEKGELRLAKLVPSPYGEGKMKSWFHLTCLFEQFLKQRANTKRLENSSELEGWDLLDQNDKDAIVQKWEEYEKIICEKYHLDYKGNTFIKDEVKQSPLSTSKKTKDESKDDNDNKDGLFREFRRLVADITNVSSYTDKTNIVQNLFTKKEGFKGDVTLWCRLLLPGVMKRIYNLQSKQLVKLFSRIFHADQSDMLEHLEQGDIGETIQHFFEESTRCKPAKKSTVTMVEVDNFLEHLSKLTREEDQIDHFKSFAMKCTANDLKMIIRLIKHDLRMNAGAKHILDAVHPEAYESYQSTRDLKTVIERCLSSKGNSKVNKGIQVLTPVLPMLAEPCKSIEQALKKCPNGMYSEIKYDGERVQLHKKGNEFKYFSRSLKPVMQHKIAHFKDYIPQAFPHGKDLVLDSEILMVDTETGKPLPFGTLGVHKREGYENAAVCLFVFDCIYFNGEVLTDKPLKTRKRILQENMTPIPNHIMFSEMKHITEPKELADMITKVLKMGLEGLVLKDVKSIYEPGKRHWLKVKKDYLFDGAIADSADLIVLGAWYGTGKKGGIMSIFLMGVYDEKTDKFKTVTKVHTGHDDKTLARLQDELKMVKISSDPNKVPNWLKCTRTMVPDFVAEDPKAQPVWEITGAEFSRQHDVHTANGISIRFPRVTKIRDDKTWKTATSLEYLEQLFATSKETFDGSLFNDELKSLSSTSASTSKNSLITDYMDEKPGTSPIKKKQRDSKRRFADSDDDDNENNDSIISPIKSPKKEVKSPVKSPKKPKLDFVEPLPSYFEGINVLLSNECVQSENEYLLRSFIAYSGNLIKQIDHEQATHVLHNVAEIPFEQRYDIQCPKTAYHVTTKWVHDSIVAQRTVDVEPYLVKLLA
ncbi:DNA ligase 3 [Atheta coriaria]|uniref:DNA ligase 3 n=1 Tax=Dalotia coriaria TaxID=877792 RepID=UPI0031F3879B